MIEKIMDRCAGMSLKQKILMCLCLLVLVATLVLCDVLPQVLAVGLIIAMVADTVRERRIQRATEQAKAAANAWEIKRRSVFTCLFDAVCKICDVIGLRRPRKLEEIFHVKPSVTRKGLEIFLAQFRFTSTVQRTVDELEDLIFELQQEMNALLATYGCEYTAASTWDQVHPLFVIDRVVQSGAWLFAEIIVSDTPEASKYLTDRQNQLPSPLPPAAPKDDLY